MSAITTHVLDTAQGRPAAGLSVALERQADDGRWDHVGRGHTDNDGRLRTLYPAGQALRPGIYRLTFDTQKYFDAQDVTFVDGFLPRGRRCFRDGVWRAALSRAAAARAVRLHDVSGHLA